MAGTYQRLRGHKEDDMTLGVALVITFAGIIVGGVIGMCIDHNSSKFDPLSPLYWAIGALSMLPGYLCILYLLLDKAA